MSPLANLTDIQSRSPTPIPSDQEPRVNAMLADASAVVRNYTRRTFSMDTTTTRIRPIGTRLRLPQRPVVSVASVKVVDFDQNLIPLTGWMWDGGDEIWLVVGNVVVNLAEGVRDLFEYNTPLVEVTYTHGFGAVPDDVVAVVCGMVLRGLAAPGMGAVRSQTAGPFSQTLSDTAVQGISAMTVSEKEVLSGYRTGRARTVELR